MIYLDKLHKFNTNLDFPSNNDEWEEPIEFNERILPLFDTTVFPRWLREYVNDVAEFTQTPADAPAIASISSLSAILSGKFEVNVVGDWVEPLNTFNVLALGPANRKSNVASLINDPITDYEQEMIKKREVELARQTAQADSIKERIDELKKSYAQEMDSDKAERLMKEITSLSEEGFNSNISKDVRLVTTDATPEELAELMFYNNEKISILSSEGAEVFEMMTGRYSNKTNIDIYLKSFSGDYIAVDRKGSKSLILQKPLMTIGLFVQPSVIKGIPSQFQNRGLTQRFLYSLPTSLIGKRDVQPRKICNNVKQKYELNMKKLLEIDFEETIKLTFSKEASIFEMKLREEIEVMLSDPDISESFQGWLGKLAGQIIRITGLLHIAKHVSKNIDDIPLKIEKETLEEANTLRNYFINHAKQAHGIMGINENEKNAKYVLGKIKEINEYEINVRSLFRRTRSFRTVKELRLILFVLEEMGYVKFDRTGNRKIIKVNPRILTED